MPADLPPQPTLAIVQETLAKPRQLTLYANGLRFSYLEWGPPTGPLVLCLHGFPDNPRTWDLLGPALGKRGYRVVAPWTRGYAPSEAPVGDDYGAETLGRDALAIATALGAQRFTVIGHDWGALAAYAAAALGPQRVARLVTVAIPHPGGIGRDFVFKAHHFLSFPMPGAPARFAADDIAGVPLIMKRWSPTWTPLATELESAKQSFRVPGGAHAIFGYYRAFFAAAASPPKVFASPFAMPALAIFGKADGAVDGSAYARSPQFFKGPYTMVGLDGVGHFPQREAPGPFETAVLEFLKPQ